MLGRANLLSLGLVGDTDGSWGELGYDMFTTDALMVARQEEGRGQQKENTGNKSAGAQCLLVGFTGALHGFLSLVLLTFCSLNIHNQHPQYNISEF